MPRKRYRSDDERLKRHDPYVRVYSSIRHPDPRHPEQSLVFEDPLLRGIWLGLVLTAGGAFAGRTQDRVVLSGSDLQWITARSRRPAAVALILKVCRIMGYPALPFPLPNHSGTDLDPAWFQRGTGVIPHSVQIVHVRNLSQNQGWDSADSAELRPPIPTPIPIPTQSGSAESGTLVSLGDVLLEEKQRALDLRASAVRRERSR